MNPNEKKRVQGDKPFPWRCPKCLKKAVNVATIPYRAKAGYDGRVYEFDIPDLNIPKCESCGELVFGYTEGEQITQALRSHLRLLSDLQIRSARKALGLSQKELAERLGPAEATISRWESGGLLQSRAMDNLLRVFFACTDVREVLCGAEQDPQLGIEVRLQGDKGQDSQLATFHEDQGIPSGLSASTNSGEQAELRALQAAKPNTPCVFPRLWAGAA